MELHSEIWLAISIQKRKKNIVRRRLYENESSSSDGISVRTLFLVTAVTMDRRTCEEDCDFLPIGKDARTASVFGVVLKRSTLCATVFILDCVSCPFLISCSLFSTSPFNALTISFILIMLYYKLLPPEKFAWNTGLPNPLLWLLPSYPTSQFTAFFFFYF